MEETQWEARGTTEQSGTVSEAVSRVLRKLMVLSQFLFHFLNTYCVSCTFIRAGDIAVKETEKNLCLVELPFWWGRVGRQMINKKEMKYIIFGYQVSYRASSCKLGEGHSPGRRLPGGWAHSLASRAWVCAWSFGQASNPHNFHGSPRKNASWTTEKNKTR